MHSGGPSPRLSRPGLSPFRRHGRRSRDVCSGASGHVQLIEVRLSVLEVEEVTHLTPNSCSSTALVIQPANSSVLQAEVAGVLHEQLWSRQPGQVESPIVV